MYSAALANSSGDLTMYSPTKVAAEEVSILQRRLADESADRDAAKMALQRVSKGLEFYRQRLSTLAAPTAGNPDVVGGNLQRVRDIVQAMEKELREMVTSDHALQEFQVPGQTPRQGYEVLRHSLEEAQRRCESLNCDMVHQAEANEELVDALGTVKDTNKRLLEQIRVQTDEISQLTTLRIGDEERMDKLTRQHQTDHEAFRQNLQRQILGIRTAASEEFGACSRRLIDKLRYLKTRIGIIAQDAGRLKQEQQRMRLDVSTIVDTSLGQMLSAERDIVARCNDHAEMYAKRRQVAEDTIDDLESKLTAEKDLRHSEGLAWAHKHSSLNVEREDIESRTSKDISELGATYHALERTLSSERHAMATERSRLEKQLEETHHNHAAMQRESDQLQRDLVRLETSRGAVESECRAKEQAIVDLRRQSRESDDALAAAVSGNEHLRDQMEEQRKRFQEKNEADLIDARSDFEQKFNDVRVTQSSDVATASRQLQDMDDSIVKDDDTLQAIATQAAHAAAEIESLDRDALMWKSQTDAIRASRAAAEKEFKESRLTFGVERLKLNAGVDRFNSQITAYDDEIRKTLDHMDEFRRLSETRETEQETRAASAEAVLRDAQEELGDLKRRFFDSLEARSRVDLEVTTTKQQTMELESTLEKDVSAKAKVVEEEKKRWEDQLNDEERITRQTKEQLGNQKEMSLSTLRRLQEDSRSKLDAVERERVRLAETARFDTAGALVSVERQQKHCDALEQDLHRLRVLFAESEANVAWIKQELEREDREVGLAVRELQGGTHTVAIELEKMTKSERSLARQIEETTKRNELEQARLMKEFDSVRRAIADAQIAPESPARRR